MQIMRAFTLLFVTFFLISFTGFSQEETGTSTVRIVGKISNQENQQAIPFANIGVIDSYIGAAANINGVFEFKVPRYLLEKTIQASAVGFSTFTAKVADCVKNDTIHIMLTPKNYRIEEINITAKSQILQGRIKAAVNRIADNYLQTPFNYDIYYRSEKLEDNELNRLREAAVRVYDSKGYQRKDAYRVFKERAYRFLQVRKNFQNHSLADGSTYLDELLEMDIVRSRGNILNVDHLDLYELNLDQITEYENDSVWVIGYKCKRPMLSNTGDYYAKSYSGKLYIKTSDYAVVKNETHVVATNYSPQGRSFYVNEERQDWKPVKIEYSFSTTYKQHSGKYYLSYVSYKRHHDLQEKATGIHAILDIYTEMLITKINTKNPEKIEKRAYYEDRPYDKKFWESYNIIFDEE